MLLRDLDQEKILNLLEKAGITSENRGIAFEYFNFSAPRNNDLLKRIALQDFSDLESYKFYDYLFHLVKGKKEELAERFLLFIVQLGASTSCRFIYFENLANLWQCIVVKKLYETLQKEYGERKAEAITIAIMVEFMNYNIRGYYAFQFASRYQDNPQPLYDALKYCTGKKINSRVLLSGIALSLTDKITLRSFFKTSKVSSNDIRLAIETIDNAITCIQTPTLYSDLFILVAALLGIDHKPSWLNIVKLISDKYKIQLVDTLFDLATPVFMNEHQQMLEDCLRLYANQIFDKYLAILLRREQNAMMSKLAVSQTPKYITTMKDLGVYVYNQLFDILKDSNPNAIISSHMNKKMDLQEIVVTELLSFQDFGKEDTKRYLFGEISLKELFGELKNRTCFNEEFRYYMLHNLGAYYRIYGVDDFIKRVLCYQVSEINMNHTIGWLYFYDYITFHVSKENREKILQIIDIFIEGKVAVIDRLRFYDNLLSNFDNNPSMKDKVLDWIAEKMVSLKEQFGMEYDTHCIKSTVNAKLLYIRYVSKLPLEHKIKLLTMCSDTSKQVMSALCDAVTEEKSLVHPIVQLLYSKKAAERMFAIEVLSNWDKEQYYELVKAALENEKSEKVSVRMKEYLYGTVEQTIEECAVTLEEKIQNILKGNKKRKLEWLSLNELPEVHFLNGETVPVDHMLAILVSYNEMSKIGINNEVIDLVRDMNLTELADYSWNIYSKWTDDGMQIKKRWVLNFTAMYGGTQVIEVFPFCIKLWAENSRGALAVEAVKAIACNQTPEALCYVDSIATKFKHRQVKTAAADAMLDAAEKMGITQEELSDRIVPNLGFGQDRKQQLDYGTRKFTLYVTETLELIVYDELNQKCKSLPAPGKKDTEKIAKESYETYKNIKKQLKVFVTNQTKRLERTLLLNRKWKSSDWIQLMIDNPLMNVFAIGLIWGKYENEKLITAFRYMEDGSYTTLKEDEIKIEKEDVIGLVHPIELSREEIDLWNEQLGNYEIVQPFPQLEREIYRITKEEIGMTMLDRFHGRKLNGLSLLGRMEKSGFFKGIAEDAGIFSYFYREDIVSQTKDEMGRKKQVGYLTTVNFSGMYIASSFEEKEDEVEIYQVTFSRLEEELGDRLERTVIPLECLDARYLSEIIVQLEQITKVK